MARTPESSFINRLHKAGLNAEVFVQSMAMMFANGTPDRYYEGRASDLFVEFKYTKVRRPRSVLPDLTELQRRWAQRRYQNNLPVAVILGCPNGGVLYVHRQWETPMSGSEFLTRVQPLQELAAWINTVTLKGPTYANPCPNQDSREL